MTTLLAAFLAIAVPAGLAGQGDGAATKDQGGAREAAALKQGARPELSLLGPLIDRAVSIVEPCVVTVEPFGGYEYDPKKEEQGGRQPRTPRPDQLGPLTPQQFLKGRGASTGLIVGADGWILTTRFVTRVNPTSIIVTLSDGRKFTAERKGEDRSRGIALLKIDADALPVPEFVPQKDVVVGQWSFALGRTFGARRPTVHAGIVSALGRIDGKAVQTDAYTSPVNYGGPLIDLEGRVLGLVCPLSPRGDTAGADWYDSGIGFAAGLADLGEILDGLKEGKVFKKGLLGVAPSPGDLGPGAVIARTPRRTTPAGHAGMRKGDKILAVDGAEVRNPAHLQWLIGGRYEGDLVELRYERKKDQTVVEVWVELDGRD
ncbi:MAG: trypsin-like peptidase domain-containing protein [Planctomycetota bacterium]